MGLTNIHHADQVLEKAGRDIAIQAVIARFNRGVLLVGRDFPHDEVDTFTTCLHTTALNQWITANGEATTTPVGGESIIQIPTLYTSPGLEDSWNDNDQVKDKDGHPVELAWIIIVRGRAAGLISKVRVFYSIFAVAAGILEEALQGLSVVFSAAMLKQDVVRLLDTDPSFRKVISKNALVEGLDGERSSILLCC